MIHWVLHPFLVVVELIFRIQHIYYASSTQPVLPSAAISGYFSSRFRSNACNFDLMESHPLVTLIAFYMHMDVMFPISVTCLHHVVTYTPH